MSKYKKLKEKEFQGSFGDSVFVELYIHAITGEPVVSIETITGEEGSDCTAFQNADTLRDLGQYICDLAFDLESSIANGQ